MLAIAVYAAVLTLIFNSLQANAQRNDFDKNAVAINNEKFIYFYRCR